MNDLCNYVDSGGVSRTFNAQLQQAEEKLLDAKCSFFQASIIQSALDEILMKFELKSLKQKPSPLESKLYSTVRNGLSCGEVCNKYLSHGKDESEEGFLCLTKDFVLNHCNSADPKSLQGIIIPELEASVRERCKLILQYHGQASSDYSTFSDISKFPASVQAELASLQEQKEKIFDNKRVITKQIENYYECMIDSIRMMKELIEFRRKEIDFASVMAKFYAAKCEGIALKARILELQILNETYTCETIPALKMIRNELSTREAQVEQELAEKTDLLQQYTAVGASFNSLVEEYTQLTTAIENERWALEELNKSQKQ